jgi:hypothetical protein
MQLSYCLGKRNLEFAREEDCCLELTRELDSLV